MTATYRLRLAFAGIPVDLATRYAADLAEVANRHGLVEEAHVRVMPTRRPTTEDVVDVRVLFRAASDVEAGAISRDALALGRPSFPVRTSPTVSRVNDAGRVIAPVAIAEARRLPATTCQECGRDDVTGDPHLIRRDDPASALCYGRPVPAAR